MKPCLGFTGAALAPALLFLVSCADIQLAHEFPSAYNGGHRSFGYAATPTEVYKWGYERGKQDRREQRSQRAGRHDGAVPFELKSYYQRGYADGYAGKVSASSTIPCWETALDRRTYSGSCGATEQVRPRK